MAIKRKILDFKEFSKDAKTKESYPKGNGSEPEEIKIKNDNLKEGIDEAKTSHGKLRKNYANFEEFKAWDETYNLSGRLGYKTAKEAWDENPEIQWSTDPADFSKWPSAKKESEQIDEKMTKNAQKFVSRKIAKLRSEGRKPSQAAAIAYNNAREEGYKVPDAK